MTAAKAGVVHRIASAEAMEELGARLAAGLRGGCVVFLIGDLGSGKTTLVRGLLRALGHRGVVPSPTFTLLETYDTGGLKVVHLDLYRLDGPAELDQLAIRDYLGEQSVLLVEWPERAQGRLPRADCEVCIAMAEDGRRTVRLDSRSRVGEGFCTA